MSGGADASLSKTASRGQCERRNSVISLAFWLVSRSQSSLDSQLLASESGQ